MENNDLNYLSAIVIVHGKSEYQMCDFIISKLKLNCHIEADKKGEKSIQITSVMNKLRNTVYKDFSSFVNKFPSVNLIDVKESITRKKGNKKKNAKQVLSKEFKIFIIMDTDDCTRDQRENFVNKKMFKGHWAYDYIVPIFNDSNLEEVMQNCKIKFKKRVLREKRNI